MNRIINYLVGWLAGFACAVVMTVTAGEGLTLPGVTTCTGLTDSGTACKANTGTSGATIPLNNGANIYSGANKFPDGTPSVPSIRGTTQANSGINFATNGQAGAQIVSGGNTAILLDGSRIRVASTMGYNWSSGADPTATGPDTGLERISAAVVQANSGEPGSAIGALRASKISGSGDSAIIIGKGYAVGSLPTGVTGMRGWVTDQMTTCPVLSGTFTGGGSVICSAFYNGTAWVHE